MKITISLRVCSVLATSTSKVIAMGSGGSRTFKGDVSLESNQIAESAEFLGVLSELEHEASSELSTLTHFE